MLERTPSRKQSIGLGKAGAPRQIGPTTGVAGNSIMFASVGSEHFRQRMFQSPDRTLSSSHGTLAGVILWLSTIAFVFAIVTGLVG
jgi:hypothetical protein